MSKNIKSENVNSKIFSEDEIIQAIDVINRFSSSLEDSRVIMATLLLKQANDSISLDEESQQLILGWAKDLTLLKEKMRLLNEGSKFH